jgi:hypothetical protein
MPLIDEAPVMSMVVVVVSDELKNAVAVGTVAGDQLAAVFHVSGGPPEPIQVAFCASAGTAPISKGQSDTVASKPSLRAQPLIFGNFFRVPVPVQEA